MHAKVTGWEEVLCRHILSALYNVAERYDGDAIWSVLRELTPRSTRIMWASKTHEVCPVSDVWQLVLTVFCNVHVHM